MRITRVEPVLLKGEGSYGNTTSATEPSDLGDWQMLVRVSTDEGLVGWSDVETLAPAAVSIIAGQGMSVCGFQTLADILCGEDPLDTERLWDKMYVGSSYYGRRGIAMHCMSAIDNCLWSIRAQAAGVPLYELLGVKRWDRVTAYASTLYRDTPEANAAAARGYVKKGFRAVKFGWGVFGEDPARDDEAVAAIREALGPDRHLLIDPGWFSGGWKGTYKKRSRDDNLNLCQRMARHNVGWLEDFIHPEDFQEYAYVCSNSPVKIAAGEQVSTVWDFERFISMGCVNVIQPDLTRCGGLTVARKVAEMAAKHNIGLVPHSWLSDLLHSYSLHLIATLPEAMFLEFNVSQSKLTRGICGGALALNDDGTVSVPSGIGSGVPIDGDFVNSHRVCLS